MYKELEKIAVTVQNRLSRYQLKGRTITLKIKYSDFKIVTRNHSFTEPTDDLDTILSTAKQLLSLPGLTDKKVRLLGLSLSNFGVLPRPEKKDNTGQLELF